MTDSISRQTPFADAATSPTIALTESGVARRDRMLGELVGEMRRVHRRRRGRRVAMVLLPVGAMAIAVLWWRGSALPVALSPGRETTAFAPTPAPVPIDSPAPAVSVPVAIITMVRTTDDAFARSLVTTPPHASEAQTINDAELLATLADLNRPAGIVRSGGKAWLTRNVTDATGNSSQG